MLECGNLNSSPPEICQVTPMKQSDNAVTLSPVAPPAFEENPVVGTLIRELDASEQPCNQRRAKPKRTVRLHKQAKKAVQDYIQTHNLRVGSRLPTEENLCRHLGWSRTTVVRALNELANEGILNRVQGSGTYVAQPVKEERIYRILVASEIQAPDDDYCAPLLTSLLQEAAVQGVDIAYHPQRVPSLEVLKQMKVDGVVAISWSVDDVQKVLALRASGVQIVGLALRSRSHQLPLICTDNFNGMRQAVEHLLSRGHRLIAYTCASMANSDNFERLAAFQYAMAGAGLSVDPAYLQVQISDLEREVSFLETWWKSMNPKPTALIIDARDAPAVLAALLRQGLTVPGDVSVIVMDERASLRHHWPALTVVKQPIHEIGRRGLSKLLEMLHGTDEGEPEILPVELIVRDSVRVLTT